MEIIATAAFIKSAKRIAKKYRSFNDDYQRLIAELGEGFRKVRMAISSKGKGKSGGCRVITLDMLEKNGCLYLLYAYDKSEHDNIILSVIKDIAKDLNP